MGYNARPNQSKKYKQGYFKPVNESKYISNIANIVYRSGLELKFCNFVDLSKRVLKWGSEVVGVPYIGPDNKKHTYYIDYYIEVENKNHPGGMERLLVEVKPAVETERIIKNEPPQKPKKATATSLRNWEYALKEFMKNKHKWAYAQEYARQRNMRFVVVTEKTLGQLLNSFS